jgi:hypothetical protein
MTRSCSWVLRPRIIWVVLAIFAIFSAAPPQVQAALVASQLSDGQVVSQRSADLDTVRQALEHQLVSQRLADYGFSKEEVQLKLQSMTDAQLHQLASVSDSLAEGADGLGVVVTILVIILLIIVILKISDRQIVIK